MTVKELNKDQLNELKQDYFYNHLTEQERYDIYFCYWDIPNEIIFDFYNGIEFVKEDFFIDNNYEPIADYDSPEEIQKCLNCEKAECDNCLKTINGV